MKTQSLTIILSDPPQTKAQNFLLDDYISTEIKGVPVFASVAPWDKLHDLLVDRETQTLAGIVYPVAAQEQAAVATICQSLPAEVIRYCISPTRAAAALNNSHFQLTEILSETGDPNITVKQFPEVLRPYRQAIRSCFLGETDLNEIPQEIRIVAAQHFEEKGETQWTSDTARVEISWINKAVNAELPNYFPSAFDIELAQYFAEDIWFYREDNGRVFAVGFNYLDKTLESYGLRLPEIFGLRLPEIF
jgi:hypothetical protein